jgi:YD repeat-containing protein
LNFAIPASQVRVLLDRAGEPRPLIAAARGAGDDRERYELIGPVRQMTHYSSDAPTGRTRVVFDREGRVVEMQAGMDGASVRYQYDDNGRLKSETHTGGEAPREWVFRPRGSRVVEATEPVTRLTKRVEYDERQRVLSEEVRADGLPMSSVRWTYPPDGWPSRNDGSAPVKEERDALGNPTKRVLADGAEVTYTYHLDARGNWVGREQVRLDPQGGRTELSERRDIDYWE